MISKKKFSLALVLLPLAATGTAFAGTCGVEVCTPNGSSCYYNPCPTPSPTPTPTPTPAPSPSPAYYFNNFLPVNAGDVVGRDLAYPGLTFMGHVGFWDGSQVVEVLNQTPVVQKNGLATFKSKSAYWGVVRPNVPNYNVTGCFSADCTWNPFTYSMGYKNVISISSRFAMAQRAYQIYLIGANYTMTALVTSALPYENSQLNTRRGMYRCDTFVKDLFYTITNPSYNGTVVLNASYFPSTFTQTVTSKFATQAGIPYELMKTLASIQ